MAAHATLGVSEAHYVDYPVTARRLMILTRVMIPTRVVTRTLRWSIRRARSLVPGGDGDTGYSPRT